MISPEDTHVSLIPRNFIERGTFMGGMFKIRNAVEGGILATVVTRHPSAFNRNSAHYHLLCHRPSGSNG